MAVIAAFGMVSCGGPSVCDCVNEEEESEECKEMKKDWEKEYKDASDEEKEEMMKEVKDCQKEGEDKEGEE